MPIDPYNPIRGSSVKFKLTLNSPIADIAVITIKKTDDTVILPYTDMTLEKPGVYIYQFQTDETMDLCTYNAFCSASLNNKVVRSKQAFVLRE